MKFSPFRLIAIISTILISSCDSHSNHSGPEKDTSENISKLGIPDNRYESISPKDSCTQPIVIEFFAYQCPHCYTLEDHIEKWSPPKGVTFKQVPTDLGDKNFRPFVYVHVLAEKLGILDKVKPLLFERIHQHKKGINSPQEVGEILLAAGSTAQAVEDVLKDEADIQARLNNHFNLLMRYKITTVPDLLVNYQYRTSPSQTEGYDKVFPTVEQLLKLPANCLEKTPTKPQ
ncbi:thiol:disulfide interchange protein DsbA/DsbL [Pleionea sp. CnH1-48]|uniref:thiol:disulfide interchange protein DsbA/DsbL n=1 Tax=Pleionea sp. CnH1-48 TaxID=2954494 RepID=UPI002096A2B6|nr:thiol:disulfide interchange protein DsbA/DsbL [Pleionea sp. CnH1-48]MCO7225487.1 thiol:disulfide interchange protein DsbA/DsbL [Pleionea sp. CnH1-48]